LGVSKTTAHGTFEKIYAIVRQIPAGRVATYGQIAALTAAGLPARIVGYALHGLPEKSDIPWHRVINSRGTISFSPGRDNYDSLQRRLLEDEGVFFNPEGKVDLRKYLWQL
jgi:methylated-DNA-protein-cysteine methyltransferase-like protein